VDFAYKDAGNMVHKLIVAALVAACARGVAPLTNPADKAFQVTAPDSFDIEFITTRGRMLVRAHRAWSPKGVDRLYALTRNNYYDSVAFYRVVPGFVAQFGFTPDSAVSRAWSQAVIPDEPVRTSNVRGTLVYARSGPDTRSVQMYFNIVDNARLDTLNGFGFPPVAKIVEGVEVLDSLYSEYGNRPQQGMIARQGTAYLKREFPLLDYIVRARIVKTWN
jgi:cyclophilin family peptidyl-prolyl cis-trans isomerase